MRDEREDVARLFRCLVETLAERDPRRLDDAFQVAEIYQTVLPYRQYRTRLGFDTNQDYEMALLRLLAGEGGYASVDPIEAHEALVAEADAVNPDAGMVREFAGAAVRLARPRIEAVLHADRSYAPPDPSPEERPATAAPAPAEPPPAPEPEAVADDVAPAEPVFALDAAPSGPAHEPARLSQAKSAICQSCGRGLPLHRAVTFCPFCGRPAGTPTCATCGAQLQPGWRFCVDCGEPSAPAGRGA